MNPFKDVSLTQLFQKVNNKIFADEKTLRDFFGYAKKSRDFFGVDKF